MDKRNTPHRPGAIIICTEHTTQYYNTVKLHGITTSTLTVTVVLKLVQLNTELPHHFKQ